MMIRFPHYTWLGRTRFFPSPKLLKTLSSRSLKSSDEAEKALNDAENFLQNEYAREFRVLTAYWRRHVQAGGRAEA